MQNARKHPIANFASRFVLVLADPLFFSSIYIEFNVCHYREVHLPPNALLVLYYSNIGGVFRLGRSAALFRNDSVQEADRVCFIPTSPL